MRAELARVVHGILTHGLQLKERLDRGESLSLRAEQEVLKRMLLSQTEAERWPEYGGDIEGDYRGAPDSEATRMGPFQGIRYALVCWLDELFILDSPWESSWNEQKLEMELYGSNDRAWRFWEQARLAAKRPAVDGLEAFFLCVMLGFRGELREEPAQLQMWVQSARTRVVKELPQEWIAPPQLEPVTNVPPLRGRESMQRMVLSGGALLLVLLPIVAFLIVLQMAG